jgi:hypothetical protein
MMAQAEIIVGREVENAGRQFVGGAKGAAQVGGVELSELVAEMGVEGHAN